MYKDKRIIQRPYFTSRSWAALIFAALLLIRITSISLTALYHTQADFVYQLTFQSLWYLSSLGLTLGLSFLFVCLFDIQLRFASLFRLYFVSRSPYLGACLLELLALLIKKQALTAATNLSIGAGGIVLSCCYLAWLNRREAYLTTNQNFKLVIATGTFQLFSLLPEFLQVFS
ncbi:hypothetical protein JEM51_07520 [Ligilactobacillus agilis]|uniref:hypothetical protein n=1 Tax=Ligilactobacillus agilis TaxID=1601 RepID=UPI00191D3943|nr:hypothetical protein [Ligilactobacillus agilis]MBL1056274.1 hypothetical protein [Ligilactobacillus agilis]